MAHHRPKGGSFKGAAQGDEQNHVHASQMAHTAAKRLAVAKELSGKGKAPGVTPPAKPVAPATPAAPSAAVPNGPHGYKAQIAGHVAQQGVAAGPNEIHAAIDGLTQQGHFTPNQGQALKAHNGPLVGPAGAKTAQTIAQHLLSMHGVGQ